MKGAINDRNICTMKNMYKTNKVNFYMNITIHSIKLVPETSTMFNI